MLYLEYNSKQKYYVIINKKTKRFEGFYTGHFMDLEDNNEYAILNVRDFQ